MISFRIINKIAANHQEYDFTITKLWHRYFCSKFPKFDEFFWMIVYRVISTEKNSFKFT